MSARAVTPTAAAPVAVVTPLQRPLLQRTCDCGEHTGGGECEGCKKKKKTSLQRHASGSAAPAILPPIVHEVLRSPGQALDDGTQTYFTSRFGHDFSHVRVHTDQRAAESAQAVGALAYTTGRNVVFGAGQYRPGTKTGQQVLAHELAHVLQTHKRGGHAEQSPRAVSHPADAAEREATTAARQVMSGGDTTVVEAPEATLHRLSQEEIKGLEIGGAVLGGIGLTVGISLGIAYLSGMLFTENQLQTYLKKLDDTNKIEDSFNSDQKAQKIVDSWAKGETKFVLTIRRRALMVQEMLKGHVSHWDKNGILNILERSDDVDLNYLFGPGGVSHATLIAKLDGWKEEVQRFYKRRYKGVDVFKVKDFSSLKAESLGPIQPGDEVPQEDSDELVGPLSGTKKRTRNRPIEPAESDKWVNELYGSYLAKDKAGGHFIQQNIDVNIAKDQGEDDTADAQFGGALSPHCQKEKQFYTSQKKKERGGKPLSPDDQQEINSRFQYCVSNPNIAGFYESPEQTGGKKGQIWIHSGRESATTRLHESLHAYADPSVTAALPHFASEGMTEYFTRQIAVRKNLAISTSYEGPFLAIQEFSARFGEPTLAQIYFQGHSSLLCKKLVQRFGEGAFKDWSVAMSGEDSWQDAIKVMQRPKPAKPPNESAECAP